MGSDPRPLRRHEDRAATGQARSPLPMSSSSAFSFAPSDKWNRGDAHRLVAGVEEQATRDLEAENDRLRSQLEGYEERLRDLSPAERRQMSLHPAWDRVD